MHPTEVNDVKYQYNSSQMRDYLSDGRPVDLYVRQGTTVSKPLVRDISATGTIKIAYSRLPGGRLVSQWQGGETFWYHLDGLGSTIAMTDESGKVRNRYGYDEYGNPTNATSEQIFNRYTFTGQAWDAGVGLYHYKARYYNPQAGWFLTQDTWRGSVWSPWTQNPYVYVGNNLVNYVDPTGHRPDEMSPGEYNRQKLEEYRKKQVEAAKPVTVVIRAYIPSETAENPFNGDVFKGDGRGPQWEGGTFRTEQELTITPGSLEVGYAEAVGQTVNLTTGEKDRASNKGLQINWVATTKDGSTVVLVTGSVADPLVWYAQPLDYQFMATVSPEGKVSLRGAYDLAPSYEIWVKREGEDPVLAYERDSNTIWTLGLPPVIPVNVKDK